MERATDHSFLENHSGRTIILDDDYGSSQKLQHNCHLAVNFTVIFLTSFYDMNAF